MLFPPAMEWTTVSSIQQIHSAHLLCAGLCAKHQDDGMKKTDEGPHTHGAQSGQGERKLLFPLLAGVIHGVTRKLTQAEVRAGFLEEGTSASGAS